MSVAAPSHPSDEVRLWLDSRAALLNAESRYEEALAVADELYAAGGLPRTIALTGPQSLTEAERRVVDLAAVGNMNGPIAEALFVTPERVELHLGNAYRKLGVAGRRELSAAMGAVRGAVP